jgi:uncharacterized protein YpmS
MKNLNKIGLLAIGIIAICLCLLWVVYAQTTNILPLSIDHVKESEPIAEAPTQTQTNNEDYNETVPITLATNQNEEVKTEKSDNGTEVTPA